MIICFGAGTGVRFGRRPGDPVVASKPRELGDKPRELGDKHM